MKRHAEDAIWANQIKLGEKILKFICSITQDRDDASAIRKGKFLQGSTGILNFPNERLLLAINVVLSANFLAVHINGNFILWV